MKKSFAAVVTVSALMLGGCATSYPIGGILTDVTLPAGVTEHAAAKKTGVAKCQSILALVANGDCSIEAAKKDGGITKDRKSTRLNSSHVKISYAVFCLKKKKKTIRRA